ncbi:MAG: hypothetical protein A2Z99_09750 [Treponema sp. GWB1_62_6]|nr:MAG: hypothetical protein A2Z99_09750 [Treponema sp. GWB1_62_6]OHE62848.1 MAG: hypothetical protein A2Y36_15350 [Treponema sp. GWA1_62_8]OHE66012.1 MAG: hypothetical protein A2001_15595 [Treponema sp. GWC1_61_84]OHE73426.1 MAG: hypothetical protein A2413_03580 [Treponema sp. RIFOXYC1_FULL_61_9]HCM25091.1 hypothetical protein [Treponema sp.]
MELIGKALFPGKSDFFSEPEPVHARRSSYPPNPHHPFILPSCARTIFIRVQGGDADVQEFCCGG